jgi:endonuclease/exonuclease/phosphatase family metal-dependent hydrolase
MQSTSLHLIRFLLRATIVAAVCLAASGPAIAGPLRIVSWNLEWFPGKKPEPTAEESAAHMAQAQKAIAELNPDVLLLQEVRDWKSAAELCKAVPGLQPQVVSAFQPRPQNQVIASKFPADSGWSAVWKTNTIEPPRGYAFAAIELPGHRFLLTYSLHLKSNRGEAAEDIPMREESSAQLLRHARDMLALYSKRGPCALVVAGDMNTSMDDPQFEKEQTLRAWMAAGLRWTHEGVPFAKRISIPAEGRYRDNCFDHIFTAGLGKQTASVHPFTGISDHNPVVLELDLAKSDFKPKIDVEAGEKLLKTSTLGKSSADGPVDASFAANDHDAINAAVGKNVAVKGRVHDVTTTASGSIVFINFEGNARGQFVAIVRKEKVEALTAALGSDLKAFLTGKTVEIRGELVLYKTTPEIVVTSAKQIKVVDTAGR